MRQNWFHQFRNHSVLGLGLATVVNSALHINDVDSAAKSHQLCLTLCDPIDGSPPGSSIPEILQARTLEWVAIFFSNAWKWKVKVKSLSRVWLLATPWTVAYKAPPFMGFPRQEYWSGVPLPSPRQQGAHCPFPLLGELRFLPISFQSIINMSTPA